MNDALPALIPGLINSVIAPRGNPPPMGFSRQGKPILRRLAVAHEGRGKRSASRLRRSIILALAAIEHKHDADLIYVQENIFHTKRVNPHQFPPVFAPGS